jgi:hypothetical protein
MDNVILKSLRIDNILNILIPLLLLLLLLLFWMEENIVLLIYNIFMRATSLFSLSRWKVVKTIFKNQYLELQVLFVVRFFAPLWKPTFVILYTINKMPKGKLLFPSVF